jgi:hypothetical protein
MFSYIKESLETTRFFIKSIWNHRWWDYYFFQIFLDKQLEFLEVHYGRDSHFIGDTFTRGRIMVLRKYLKEWIECDEFKEYECKEKRKRFFLHLERNFEKFWD